MGKTIFTIVFLIISLLIADKVKTFVKNNNYPDPRKIEPITEPVPEPIDINTSTTSYNIMSTSTEVTDPNIEGIPTTTPEEQI